MLTRLLHLLHEYAIELKHIKNVVDGKVVQINGFGKFHLNKGKARTMHPPKLQEPITVPAQHRIRFAPASRFKDQVHNRHHHQDHHHHHEEPYTKEP